MQIEIVGVAQERSVVAQSQWISGRGEWIRTTDLLVPNQAL